MSQSYFGGRANRGPKKSNSNNNRFGGRGRSSQPRQKGARKQFIHPSKFINRTAVDQTPEVYEPTHLFTDFALDPTLQKNLAALKFTAPSAIQDQAIPLVLDLSLIHI